ncbi:amidase [Nitratireductor soli]|uniref:amidase n=1 Tax=Nitratireductor soli TaxID=1670619 RepID=UPI00065E455E|nr:amidase [Nitratireductor soli]
MTDPIFAPISEILSRLEKREITARDLTVAFLDRIEAHNAALGAVTDILAETAGKTAARIDEMRAQGSDPGPLGGLPVLVKDIIDTVPAVCSAGLPFLSDRRPQHDAWIVKRLRDAGAVILGVTATDPGAFGVRTEAVRHPVWPDFTVGGSSGGSGAALAAGFGYLALGTDTGGSIRIPAAACEIAGLKPTYGCWPLQGIRPLTHTLDHVGPMARSVADLVSIWQALEASGGPRLPDNPVIGFDPSGFAEADPIVHEGMEAALAGLRRLGCTIVEVSLPSPERVIEVHGVVLLSEAAALYQAEGLAEHPDLPDLPRSNLKAGGDIPASRYIRAMQARKEFTRQVDAALKSCDVLMMPTLPVTPPARFAPSVLIAGDEHDFTLGLVRYTCLFDHTGHPALAMPASAGRDAPGASIQLATRRGGDAELLNVGAMLEQELGLNLMRHGNPGDARDGRSAP